jgi:hypothetical protein
MKCGFAAINIVSVFRFSNFIHFVFSYFLFPYLLFLLISIIFEYPNSLLDYHNIFLSLGSNNHLIEVIKF